MPSPPLAYTFRPQEDVRNGFGRLLTAISRRGRGLERHARRPLGDAIHELRLLIKRARALLWFARPALRPSAYTRAKTRLRKAAQLLAGQRDLTVTKSTLEDLNAQAAKARDRTALAHALRHTALNASGAAQERSLRSAFKKAVEILDRSVNEIKRSVAAHSEWLPPADRLKKAFHATRKAGKKARATGKDVDFHTWRKKAKRLLYQLELTQSEPRRRMSQIMKQVTKLQDSLGSYHDCVVVENHLRQMLPLSAAERRVANLLGKRKAHLRKKARKITRQLNLS